MPKINFACILRIFLGLIFLVSAVTKLTTDYQNFLVVVQNYKLFSPWVEDIIARVVPWLELIFGLTLVLGFYVKESLYVSLAMAIGFLVFTGSAVIRGIDIADCGCFGELLKLPVHYVVVIDLILITASAYLLTNVEEAKVLGLDSSNESQS